MGPPDARLDRTGAPESARGVPPALGGRRADQNRQGPLGRHHHRADVAQHRLCRARRLRALAPGSGAAAPAAAAWSSVPGTAAEHPGPGAARGVDRDRGAGPGRPRGLRGGAGADGREPPTPSGTPTSPRLAAAGARGLPAVRLRLLRAKMARGRVGGRQPADYGHHRCTGTDAHRFAGQAVCDNKSCASCRLERAVWDEIRAVLADPERVAAEHRRRLAEVQESPGDAEGADLDRRIAALRRGIGRLIDGYGLGAERARRVRAPRRGDEAAPIPHRGGAAEAARGRRSREGPDAARRPPERLRREGPPRPGRLGLERHPRGHPGDGPAGRGRRGPRQRRLPRAAPIAARERWPPPRSNPATRPWSARLSRPSRRRRRVDAHHVRAALDLAVEALEGVRAVQLGAVLGGEGHGGQDVHLAVVHELGELGPPRAELVRDVAPDLARALRVGLGEGPARIAAATMVCWLRGTWASALRNPMQAGSVERGPAGLPRGDWARFRSSATAVSR